METLSKDLMATVLLEAVYSSDDIACAKYGISVRSLRRYRRRLVDDPDLAEIVRSKKLLIDKAWAERLPSVLDRGIRLISECADAIAADKLMCKNPEVIHAISGAIKICADVLYTGKLIDARIADANRPETSIPRSSIANSASETVQ